MSSSTAGQVVQGLSGPALVGAYSPGQVLAVLDGHLASLFTRGWPAAIASDA